MNHDFKDFIEGKEKIPSIIYSDTLKLARISLNPKFLLMKFYILNLLGALATLTICPQYGVGPFGGHLGFVNLIMGLGPVACGIFCSVIFFAGGNILSWLCLSSIERKWIYKNEYSVITPYVAVLFVIGMAVRSILQGHIHHDVISYYGSWLVTGFLFSIILLTTMYHIKKVQDEDFSKAK